MRHSRPNGMTRRIARTSLLMASLCVSGLMIGQASTADAASAYSISPTTLGFNDVTVGADKVAFVTVTNKTDLVYEYVSSFKKAGGAFELAQSDESHISRPDACWFTDPISGSLITTGVQPHESCRLYFKFTPTESKNYTASASISVTERSDNPKNYAATVSLRGGGVDPTFTVSPIDFGAMTVKGQYFRDITVTNTSGIPLGFYGVITPESGTPYVRDEGPGTCTTQDQEPPHFNNVVKVNPDDTCVMRILARPTATISKIAKLSVVAYDLTSTPDGQSERVVNQQVVARGAFAIKGKTYKPTITVAPDPLDFGRIFLLSEETDRYRSVTVKNTSDVPLAVRRASFAGSAAFNVGAAASYTDCTRYHHPFAPYLVIQPGQSCDYLTHFQPEKRGGFTATVTYAVHVVTADAPIGHDPLDGAEVTSISTDSAPEATFTSKLKGSAVY